MERLPSDFAKRLESVFDGRYRMRWSNHKREWHLEQKVGRAQVDVPIRDDSYADDVIRARDGYVLVMAIQPGTQMACPYPTELGPTGEVKATCGFRLKVPVRETREVRCPWCAAQGKDGRVAAAFFPLDETLIDHIKSIDYYLGHNEKLGSLQDARNRAILDTIKRDGLNDLDAVSYETRKTFAGIEQVGYGRSIIRPVG